MLRSIDQAATDTLKAALNTSSVLIAKPRLIAEWNMNRYAKEAPDKVIKVDNDPPEDESDNDLSIFPIRSIIGPQRPAAGIIKARTSPDYVRSTEFVNPGGKNSGPTTTVIQRGDEGFTSPQYTKNPTKSRYYTAGDDAPFKYWSSPGRSDTSEDANGAFSFKLAQGVRPYVEYPIALWANKVVVGVENNWASPKSWTIQIRRGGVWTTIATNPSLDADGRAILYLQANGTSWASTINRGNPVSITGLRLNVGGLDKPDAFFNLIELSPRLEFDLSEHLLEWSCSFSQSEASAIAPFGVASSNTANVSLSNVYSNFENDALTLRDISGNPTTTNYLAGLIERNIKFTLDLEYTINGATVPVRQFTMYSDSVSGQGEEEVNFSLKDSSKFLQEEKVPHIYMENATLGEIVWRTCDAVGFTNYIYDSRDVDPATAVNYFWTNEDEMVWDVFSSIAEGTQSAIYFDEYDRLLIQTRDKAYDLSVSVPQWNFQTDNKNGKLADIQSLSKSAEFEANTVNVKYTERGISEEQNGFPKMETVWEPEGTFVLRASPLVKDFLKDDVQFRINPSDARYWPYEGTVNIQGEILDYSGKQYHWYDKKNVRQLKTLYSAEDKKTYDDMSSPTLGWMNSFNGDIRSTERDTPRNHYIKDFRYTGKRFNPDNDNSTTWNGGHSLDSTNSLMRLSLNTDFNADNGKMYTMSSFASDAHNNESFNRYGCRIRLPSTSQNSGQNAGIGGMAFNLGSGEQGYFVEVIRSYFLDRKEGANRKFYNEIRFFTRDASGKIRKYGSENGKGSAFLIASNVWYDLDIVMSYDTNGAHIIIIYIDGVECERITLTGNQRLAKTGRFGLYGRGTSISEYEYMYAYVDVGNPIPSLTYDESSYFDKQRGGYVSGRFDYHYLYSERWWSRRISNKKNKKYLQNYRQWAFDEFGPIVHEIREVTVPFSKTPVRHSRFYMSNDLQATCPDYNADNFEATFVLANTSRDNAVLNGTDTLTYGSESPVEQKMFVYGRIITEGEEKVKTVKNENSIRRAGPVEVDFDSRWVQNEAEAKSLGGWIVKHWGDICDEIELQTFGNPLVQLGDYVSIDNPDAGMTAQTHRYFVVQVNRTWNDGLETTFTLRRAR